MSARGLSQLTYSLTSDRQTKLVNYPPSRHNEPMDGFCGFCGERLKSGYSFCPKCGSAQESILDAEIVDEVYMPMKWTDSDKEIAEESLPEKNWGLPLLAVLITFGLLFSIGFSIWQGGPTESSSTTTAVVESTENSIADTTPSPTELADRKTCQTFWSMNLIPTTAANDLNQLRSVQFRDNSTRVSNGIIGLVNALNYHLSQRQKIGVSQIQGNGSEPEGVDLNSYPVVTEADQAMEKICGSIVGR